MVILIKQIAFYKLFSLVFLYKLMYHNDGDKILYLAAEEAGGADSKQ